MHALLLTLLALPLPQGEDQPAGLVFVPGGTTQVGAEVNAAKERIQKHQADANYLAGETPRHQSAVAPFYIAPTPVTNEMYLAFVVATGAVPPSSWADLDGKMRAALIVAGKEEYGPAYKFDEDAQNAWWKAHWQDEGITWSLPADRALEPVVFVTMEDVLSYCEWAGLRLPTEEEWVRAARGDGSNDYPWGNEADNSKAAFNATMPRKLAAKRLPVGSLANANSYGIYDMAGQVFEFTSSRASAFEDYKSFEVKILDERGKLKEKITPSPSWDMTMVILKGGSFLNPLINCRIDARIPFRPDSAARVLGFRVAASTNSYGDLVQLRTRHFRSNVLGGTATTALALSESVGLLKRDMPDMAGITAKRKPHPDFPDAPGPPESYAVFGPISAIAVAPAQDPFGGDFKHAAIATVDRGIIKEGRFPVVGALVTTVDLAEPALPAGSYSLRYLPGMKKKDLEKMGAWIQGEERPVEEEGSEPEIVPIVPLNGFEITPGTIPSLIVIDGQNQPVAVIKVKGGKVFYKPAASVDPGVVLDPERKALDILLRLPGKSSKAYSLSFTLHPVDPEGNSLTQPADWGSNVQGK